MKAAESKVVMAIVFMTAMFYTINDTLNITFSKKLLIEHIKIMALCY